MVIAHSHGPSALASLDLYKSQNCVIFPSCPDLFTRGPRDSVNIRDEIGVCRPLRSGIAVAMLGRMTINPTQNAAAANALENVPVVRWVFHRGSDALTCEVDARQSGGGYDICVVPHWDVASALVEPVDTTVSALRRHAEIARALREAGWSVARRS